MAYISVAYLWHFHMVYFNSDFMFHWDRIRGLRHNIINGAFPLINQGTSIPYGISMTYYPWLTILPLSIMSFFIKNAVDFFYMSLALIMLITYFISYYSYHTTHDKSWVHAFVFAVFYTNSSLIFDWSIRGGDIGATTSMIFLPMAYFGFIDLMKDNKHWLMMTFGIVFAITSHLITGGLLVLALSILALLNIKHFKIVSIFKALIGVVIVILITSIFWYPGLKLMKVNSIVSPKIWNDIGYGIVSSIGATCNYVYGIPELIGMLAIIKVRSKKFKVLDFEVWALGLINVIINIKWIATILETKFPLIKHLQFTNRFNLIAHLLLTVIAVKWLVGGYNDYYHKILRTPAIIITIMLLFTPIVNQMNEHFLLHNRPIININNAENVMKDGATPYKSNSRSYKSMKHYMYAYDYVPNVNVANNTLIDSHFKAPIYNDNNQWLKTISYRPKSDGIELYNNNYSNIQFPIVLYHGIKYQFSLNGHKMSKKYINKKLTWKNYELTLHNLPKGKDKVSIRSASLK